jgi:dsDNA-binding SOS-regulon protein
MKKRRSYLKSWLGLTALTTFFCFVTSVSAQSQPVQNDRPVQENDTTRQELARFDQFLDGHREIAEQLRKDPSLVDNQDYERGHPELQTFLQQHPEIREEIKENPNAFMRQEDRFDRSEGGRDDITRAELARFDQFLDSHRELAEPLRKDPSLVDNPEFERSHPALQNYLRDHPEIREQLKEHPDAFMRDEDRYDRHDGGRNDITRAELARFDQFLDSHREIAEQLRKDPSLVNNGEFTKNHPALYAYLQDHPEIREEIKENPNVFMRDEDRFDRHDNDRNHDMARDSHGQAARFGQFLSGHSNVADQLSNDPSLVKNQEYMENHPELREYLKNNPDVQKELMANPPTFVKSAKEFSNNNNNGRPVQTQPPTPSQMADPKPKL